MCATISSMTLERKIKSGYTLESWAMELGLKPIELEHIIRKMSPNPSYAEQKLSQLGLKKCPVSSSVKEQQPRLKQSNPESKKSNSMIEIKVEELNRLELKHEEQRKYRLEQKERLMALKEELHQLQKRCEKIQDIIFSGMAEIDKTTQLMIKTNAAISEKKLEISQIRCSLQKKN